MLFQDANGGECQDLIDGVQYVCACPAGFYDGVSFTVHPVMGMYMSSGCSQVDSCYNNQNCGAHSTGCVDEDDSGPISYHCTCEDLYYEFGNTDPATYQNCNDRNACTAGDPCNIDVAKGSTCADLEDSQPTAQFCTCNAGSVSQKERKERGENFEEERKEKKEKKKRGRERERE